jgi:hypothetical protein
MEELEFAKARGAKILAEVIGYGMSADAFHMTGMAPEGEGCFRAMNAAIKVAGISPDQIDYVNAHATSTPLGDALESQAIENVFGERAKNGTLLVSSTKSMTGHLLGGAGGLEAGITIMAMLEQTASAASTTYRIHRSRRRSTTPSPTPSASAEPTAPSSSSAGPRKQASRFTPRARLSLCPCSLTTLSRYKGSRRRSPHEAAPHLALLTASLTANADVALPKLFSSHMVLQPNFPQANLYNAAGLPASPFTSFPAP